MSEALTPPPDADRFTWLERPNDDFPYYRGQPVEVSTGHWWIVMFAVALAL